MPSQLQDRWRRKVESITENQQRSVKFVDLVEYMEDEARIMTNPLFGRHLLKPFNERYRTANSDSKVFATVSKPHCLKCEQDHIIHNCPVLKNMSYEEIYEFVNENKMCFNCLRTNHGVKKCLSRFRCRICNENHHTLLHYDKPKTQIQNQDNINIPSNVKNEP